jgi:hypothetical protein
MKNILENIKKIRSKIQKSGQTYTKKEINPNRDWLLILLGSQIIVILVAVLSVYLYIRVDRGDIFTENSTGEENEVKINMTILDKVVNDASNRVDEFSKILKSESPPDPSV